MRNDALRDVSGNSRAQLKLVVQGRWRAALAQYGEKMFAPRIEVVV
jgi:hypothetical protein